MLTLNIRYLFLCALALITSNFSHLSASALKSFADLDPKPIWRIEKLVGGTVKLRTQTDETSYIKAVTKSGNFLDKNMLPYALSVETDAEFSGYIFKKGDVINVLQLLSSKRVRDLDEEYLVPNLDFCVTLKFIDVLKQQGALRGVESVSSLDFKNLVQALDQ
ncbi:MAG: hypothetical protein K2X53_05850 [Alphaproteobacteria bacterium]|nr:hypothetical protein [Alphaproteobacteria bacterium]